jgi:tetratricopeptide (TPR) repeat protein
MFAILLLIALPDRPIEVKPNDTWVGKIVFIRQPGDAELDPAPEPRHLPRNADEGVYLSSNQYRVYAERADHVQIKTRDGILGWVKKTDLVPLENAVAFFTRQLELKPSDFGALNRRASAWRFRGEYDAALKDMDAALRVSSDAAGYNNRGLIWHARRDYERAIIDFSKAIELSRGSALQLVNRANSYLGNKDFDSAIADATQALAVHPAYPEAHRVRGLAQYHKKRYGEAIADLSRTIELDAKHADAFAERAAVWAARREHVKALDDFDQSLRLEPKNVLNIASAALWLASCPDPKHRDGQRALMLARAAQQLQRSNSHALQAMAAAHAELGQFAEAVRYQEQAMLDPLLKDDAAARARLSAYRKKTPARLE